MTLDEAIKDAKRRRDQTGLTWHVIDVWDEISGPTHETVSDHHPKAKDAVWTAHKELLKIKPMQWWKRLAKQLGKLLRKILT